MVQKKRWQTNTYRNIFSPTQMHNNFASTLTDPNSTTNVELAYMPRGPVKWSTNPHTTLEKNAKYSQRSSTASPKQPTWQQNSWTNPQQTSGYSVTTSQLSPEWPTPSHYPDRNTS